MRRKLGKEDGKMGNEMENWRNGVENLVGKWKILEMG